MKIAEVPHILGLC